MTNLNRQNHFGFFSTKEKWSGSDERDVLECLGNYGVARRQGNMFAHLSRKKLLEKKAFHERFPSEELHSRLVAHEAVVYKVINPSFVEKGKKTYYQDNRYSIAHVDESNPESKLEEVSRINFFDEIFDFVDHNLNHSRVPLILEPFKEIALDNPYFNITFQMSDTIEDFHYSFGFNKTVSTRREPLEIHLTGYLDVDGERVEDNSGIFRSVFETRFKRYVFNRN